MNLFNRDTESEICVIAEIGVNHGGNVSWIIEMLPQLKSAGVDAVKLQVFTPEKYVVRTNVNRFDFLKSRAISEDNFHVIQNFADQINLHLFATPLSEDWVPFLIKNCSTVKIASGDFTFLPTITSLLQSSANLVVSTGGVSKDELTAFLSLARSIRGTNKMLETIAILHCISAYPPPLQEANLNAITYLRSLTGLTIGFSNHFLSDSPIFSALALGARVFEVHVTDDRSRRDIRDHELSRTPSQMRILINDLRELNLSLVSQEKEIQPSEKPNISIMRKGLVSTSDIHPGEIFSHSNVSFARPETDLNSSDFQMVLTSKAKVFIPAHTSLCRSHLT